jgi:hypothetical protein
LAAALLLVAIEVGRGLNSEPLGFVLESSDGLEVAGRYALLIEVYVRKIIYNDGLEDVLFNKSSNLGYVFLPRLFVKSLSVFSTPIMADQFIYKAIFPDEITSLVNPNGPVLLLHPFLKALGRRHYTGRKSLK